MKKHARKDREERREERPRATRSQRDEREQSPDERGRSRIITGRKRPRERSQLGCSRKYSTPREYLTANRTSSSWYPDRSRFTLNLRSQSRRLSPRSRHDEGIYSY